MIHTNTNYKGYTIQKRSDIKTATCIIFLKGDMVKCIAGDIFADGSENSIKKAMQWIDKQLPLKYTI